MIILKILSKIENEDEVQELLENCGEYLLFQDGEPVAKDAAKELFNAIPESVEPTSKVVLGVFRQERLIGVIDLIKGYPQTEVLTLGLMLLVPSARKQGIGREAYQLLEEWAVSQGYRRIRLGVLNDNCGGLKFWPKNGFIETGDIKFYKVKPFKVVEKII